MKKIVVAGMLVNVNGRNMTLPSSLVDAYRFYLNLKIDTKFTRGFLSHIENVISGIEAFSQYNYEIGTKINENKCIKPWSVFLFFNPVNGIYSGYSTIMFSKGSLYVANDGSLDGARKHFEEVFLKRVESNGFLSEGIHPKMYYELNKICLLDGMPMDTTMTEYFMLRKSKNKYGDKDREGNMLGSFKEFVKSFFVTDYICENVKYLDNTDLFNVWSNLTLGDVCVNKEYEWSVRIDYHYANGVFSREKDCAKVVKFLRDIGYEIVSDLEANRLKKAYDERVAEFNEREKNGIDEIIRRNLLLMPDDLKTEIVKKFVMKKNLLISFNGNEYHVKYQEGSFYNHKRTGGVDLLKKIYAKNGNAPRLLKQFDVLGEYGRIVFPEGMERRIMELLGVSRTSWIAGLQYGEKNQIRFFYDKKSKKYVIEAIVRGNKNRLKMTFLELVNRSRERNIHFFYRDDNGMVFEV